MAGGSFFEGIRTGQALMDNRANQSRANVDLDLRMQELKSQNAVRQIQERAIAQEMEEKLRQRTQQIQYKSDMAQAMTAAQMASDPIVMTPAGPVPNPKPMTQEQSIMRFILPVVGKYEPDKVVPIMENMALRKVQMEREKRLGQSSGVGGVEPEMRTITDPNTGKQITVYRTGPNSWGRRPDTLPEPTATSVTDPNTGNPMTMVKTGPNSFSRVPLSSGQQQLEQTEIASGNIFENGRKLLPLINDKTTGIRGGLQRVLVSSRLGLFVPKMVDPSVPEADAVARQFSADLVRGMRSDGNINEREYQALTEEANTMKWVDERTGKSRLKVFVQGAVRKARDASLRLGRPINEKYLTLDELGKRAEAKIEAGEMTKEQAMDWATKTYMNSAEAFINDVEQQIGK